MAKTCYICKEAECCYKCPTCKEPYCSIACYKTHKSSNCQPKPENKTTEDKRENNISYGFPTEDTVPIEKLEQLCHSKELRNCLQNPHVRDIMQAILSSENPTKAIALAMTEPIFVELADACLKVVESPLKD